MTRVAIARGLAVLSMALFAVSLMLPVGQWRVTGGDTLIEKTPGEMLLLGWLGPLVLQFGWFGNPFLAFSWILIWFERYARIAVIASLMGTTLAVSSVFMLQWGAIFGRNEAESATLIAFGPGFLLWISSFVMISMASLVAHPPHPGAQTAR